MLQMFSIGDDKTGEFLKNKFIVLFVIIFDKLSFPEWWGAGVVICLGRGADLHTAQLMPLPLTVSCFSKIQIGFYVSGTGSPG